MTILFAGCSFTNGMELQDKKKTRFSNLVSKEMGHLEWNEGKIGGGNDYIQRTVQNAIIGRKRYWSTTLANVGVKKHHYSTKKFKEGVNPNQLKPGAWEQDAQQWFEPKDMVGKYQQTFQVNKQYEKDGWPDLVVCMWSGINRLENLRLSQITKDWSWVVAAWGEHKLQKENYKATYNSHLYIDRQYEPGEEEFYRGYMMRIRNSHYNLRLTLGNMMAVKYMLKAKGIPQLHYLFSSGQYKPLLHLLDLPVYENTNNWWESLDIDRATAVQELPWLESEGFYDIAKNNNCPIGVKDHPLEKAHQLMAERIIGDIKKNEFLK